MNIRQGLKIMAVAMPSMMPLKGSAQEIASKAVTKQTQKVVNSVSAKEPLIISGKVGAGYGLVPFMDKGVAEPKALLSVGITNNSLKAEGEALLGNATQSYSAKVAGIINNFMPNFGLEAGTVFRYNRNNSSKIPSLILENEIGDGSKCVATQQHTAFWGAYISPMLKKGKAEIRAAIEAGMAGFAGLRQKGISSAEIPEAIKEGRVVNRSNISPAANFGLGAKYEILKNLKLGANVNYSTFDKRPGFNVGATYQFGKDIRK